MQIQQKDQQQIVFIYRLFCCFGRAPGKKGTNIWQMPQG